MSDKAQSPNQKASGSGPSDSESPRPKRLVRGPFCLLMDRIWWISCGVLVAPALLAWVLRIAAYTSGCQPAPVACFDSFFGNSMGPAFKDLLELSWLAGAGFLLPTLVTIVSASAAALGGRPIRAALTVALLPLLALALAVLLNASSGHAGCGSGTAGGQTCLLWGRDVGASFARAANAGTTFYNSLPPILAGTVTAFLLGWLMLMLYRQFGRYE